MTGTPALELPQALIQIRRLRPTALRTVAESLGLRRLGAAVGDDQVSVVAPGLPTGAERPTCATNPQGWREVRGIKFGPGRAAIGGPFDPRWRGEYGRRMGKADGPDPPLSRPHACLGVAGRAVLGLSHRAGVAFDKHSVVAAVTVEVELTVPIGLEPFLFERAPNTQGEVPLSIDPDFVARRVLSQRSVQRLLRRIE